MDIIRRNFFRLLRSGVYGSEEQIEAMSAWKWRQLYQQASALSLAPLVYDGVLSCNRQFFMRLPSDLEAHWKEETSRASERYHVAVEELVQLVATLGNMQLRPVLLEPWCTSTLYDHPEHHLVGTAYIYFPFKTQGQKADEWAQAHGNTCDNSRRHQLSYQWKSLQVEHRHNLLQLNSRFNNSTLQSIIEQERLEGGTNYVVINGQRMECVTPTLNMLVALLNIVRTSLDEGLSLWQILDLGLLLRRRGDRVDFVKLQEWIDRLRFTRMSQLVASVLTAFLGFTVDEVPFVQPSKTSCDLDGIADDLLCTKPRSNAKYLRYNPGEGLASVVASITHKLGNVKE